MPETPTPAFINMTINSNLNANIEPISFKIHRFGAVPHNENFDYSNDIRKHVGKKLKGIIFSSVGRYDDHNTHITYIIKINGIVVAQVSSNKALLDHNEIMINQNLNVEITNSTTLVVNEIDTNGNYCSVAIFGIFNDYFNAMTDT